MPGTRRAAAGGLGIVGILLGIVIGLSLVSTVATSTTSASTALAPFSGAQALVIIVPLIFVAIILIAAYRHTGSTHMAISLEMRNGRKHFAWIMRVNSAFARFAAKVTGNQINTQ